MALLLLPGTAAVGDVLTGKKFSAGANYGAAGTMPENGAIIITPGPNAQAIPAGHHNGSGSVPGVAVPAANVLTGTTIAGTAGTMPNRGAPTFAPGTAAQGIAAGYYSGGTVNGDGNLVAGSILTGVSIFGVAGNVVKKQYATGSITPATSGVTYNNYGSGANSTTAYMLTVSGLTFQPQVITIRSLQYSYATAYNANTFITTTSGVDVIMVNTSGTTTLGYAVKSADHGYVNGTGFSLPVLQTNTNYTWEAWG